MIRRGRIRQGRQIRLFFTRDYFPVRHDARAKNLNVNKNVEMQKKIKNITDKF